MVGPVMTVVNVDYVVEPAFYFNYICCGYVYRIAEESMSCFDILKAILVLFIVTEMSIIAFDIGGF
jgi:hypothetical protein